MSGGFVYFIGPEALYCRDEATQLVKIGYTKNSVSARLAGLQCGSPLILDIWAYTNGSPDLERAFHEAFAPARSHGEWFFLYGKLRDFLDYFDRGPPGDRFVTPNEIIVSLYDNVYSDTAPLSDDISAAEWHGSADIEPLLRFFPEVSEA